MQNIISKLLKNLHEYDQEKRRAIIRNTKTKKVKDAQDKIPFYSFGGECEERARIVLFLIKNGAIKTKDDYYYAATIIINVGSLENFYLAYKLIKKYRQLGGKKPWYFHDSYFTRQNWGMTKEEVCKEIRRRIGINPSKLDKI
ncbi:MAG: hypothetical protein PHC97_04640 [Patescibacteria group bacterium]|nr:hypothetical protein [Patescibacteria group bacterium]